MSKVDLLVAPCSYQAAKYAVEKWHYSGCMPAGKTVKFGVWEDGKFIGCAIFGRGAIYRLGHPYGLGQDKICELTRIALTAHISTVSKIISNSLSLLKTQNTGLRLVVSFADPAQGHAGAVYQAANWLYCGITDQCGGREYLLNGKWVHPRSIGAKFGTRSMRIISDIIGDVPERKPVRKHRYLYPLDRAMRRQIAPLAQPYPKRERHASD